MNQLGEFSTHAREGNGDHVVKQLNPRHPAGARFIAAAARAGESGMRSYLEALRSAQVALPEELHLVTGHPLTVRHRWVPGPSLLEAMQTDPAGASAAVELIGRWVRELDSMDARLDTNLANFCLLDGQPVLVDVLPPLIPSLRPTPENLFDELFTALCFDTSVILDALVGYALRAVLRTAEQSAAHTLLRGVHEHIRDNHEPSFPTSWFRARRVLATRAAAGETAPEQVHDFFALTSVLGFRQLAEQGRRDRLQQVAQRIQELNV